MRGGNGNLGWERGRSNHMGQDKTLAGEGVTAGSRPWGQGRHREGGSGRSLSRLNAFGEPCFPLNTGPVGSTVATPRALWAQTSPTSRLSILPVSLRERRGHHIACQPSTGPSPVNPILMPALFDPHSTLSTAPVLTGPVTIGLGICHQDSARWDLLTQPHSNPRCCQAGLPNQMGGQSARAETRQREGK